MTQNKITMLHKGGCLCNKTTFTTEGTPINPHLCSCRMCQRSSGSPTVAWVSFPLEFFKWDGSKPGQFQSSEKTQRCFCTHCGGLLAAFNDGDPNVCVTIASLDNPNLIVPNETHSYKESAPTWWSPLIKRGCI